MKNLLLGKHFRALLILFMGCLPFMQAQAETLDQILGKNNGLVKITGKRSGKALYDPGVIDKAARVETKANSFASEAEWDQLWMIAADDDGYYLRNVGTGNYIKHGGTIGEKATFYINEHEGFFVFGQEKDKYPSGNKYLNIDGSGAATTWSIDDGSLFTIEGVTGITMDQIKAHFNGSKNLSALQDGKIYEVINHAYGRYLTENYTSNNYIGQDRFNNATQYFRVKKSGDYFSFQNVGSRRYVQGNPGTSKDFTPGANAVYFNVARQGVYEDYYIVAPPSNGQGWHEASTQGHKLVQWSHDAAASKWQFREIALTDEQIAAAEAEYDELNAISGNLSGIYANMKAFFTDDACTVLKDEYKAMDDEALRAAMKGLPEVIQNEILKIKNDSWTNAYEKGFRIADYGAFSAASRGQQKMRLSNALCLINNPTGVMGDGGEYVFIVVGDDIPAGATLNAITTVGYTHYAVQSKPLVKGLNMLLCENANSHVFIDYTSPQDAVIADVPRLDIHVIGGRIEGYFDHKKHTDEDWVKMQEAGLFQDKVMHILGTYSQLLVQTAGIKQYNPTKLLPLLGEFEWYTYSELEIMGLTALPDSLKDLPGADRAHEDLFPRIYNNRMLCVSDENSGQMYAGGNKICLGDAYMSSTYNYESIKNRGAEIWAPGHEYGHQMQSAIHLAASTEVSNNAFSNFLVYKGGTCTSRGWNMQRMQEEMADGTHNWPHIVSTDYWLPCQMYYSLFLYYHAAKNDELFYQKFFRLLREDPMNNGAGQCKGSNDYLHFYKKACDAAGEDLTEFFDYWGFFEPVDNVTMASYSTWYMTTTSREIGSAKGYARKNFEKKCNPAMVFIDDRVVPTYKADGYTQKDNFGNGEYPVSKCETNLEGAQYDRMVRSEDAKTDTATVAYTMTDKRLSFTKEQVDGAAGVKLRNADGDLLYVFSDRSLAFSSDFTKSLKNQIYSAEVCFPDGNVTVYLNQAALDGYLTGIDDVIISAPNAADGIYYDLTGRRVMNPIEGQLYIVDGKKVIF